jgi:hypothetical protein
VLGALQQLAVRYSLIFKFSYRVLVSSSSYPPSCHTVIFLSIYRTSQSLSYSSVSSKLRNKTKCVCIPTLCSIPCCLFLLYFSISTRQVILAFLLYLVHVPTRTITSTVTTHESIELPVGVVGGVHKYMPPATSTFLLIVSSYRCWFPFLVS